MIIQSSKKGDVDVRHDSGPACVHGRLFSRNSEESGRIHGFRINIFMIIISNFEITIPCNIVGMFHDFFEIL